MIIGTGTDIVEISRIGRLLEAQAGERFIERVLTPEERKLAAVRKARLHEFVAGRFAAKEAVSKALGCGIGRQLGLQDMEIIPDAAGKPVCRISPAAWDRLGYEECQMLIHLSLSHSETTAVAFAVAENRE